ncbi:MAG: hypothetical protein WCK36_00840 [Candidatus Firestonebacteria bacterium]
MEWENYLLNPKVAAILAISLYYIIISLFAKKPKNNEIIERNSPPPGISPALAGCIYNGEFNESALRAAYAGIGTKGFQLFKKSSPGLSIGFEAQEPGAEAKLNAEEKLLIEIGRTEEIKNLNAFELFRFMKAQTEIYCAGVRGYLKTGLFLSVLAGIIGLLNGAQGGRGFIDIFAAGFYLVWLGGWTIGTTLLVLFAGFTIRDAIKKPEKKNIIAAVILSLFVLPFLSAEIFVFRQLLNMLDAGSFLFLLALAGLNLYFRYHLRNYTEEGLRVLQELLGFRAYLTYSGEDTLETGAVTSTVYELYLPYAIALKAERQWRKRFSAYPPEEVYIPSWFKSGESALRWLLNCPLHLRLVLRIIIFFLSRNSGKTKRA